MCRHRNTDCNQKKMMTWQTCCLRESSFFRIGLRGLKNISWTHSENWTWHILCQHRNVVHFSHIIACEHHSKWADQSTLASEVVRFFSKVQDMLTILTGSLVENEQDGEPVILPRRGQIFRRLRDSWWTGEIWRRPKKLWNMLDCNVNALSGLVNTRPTETWDHFFCAITNTKTKPRVTSTDPYVEHPVADSAQLFRFVQGNSATCDVAESLGLTFATSGHEERCPVPAREGENLHECKLLGGGCNMSKCVRVERSGAVTVSKLHGEESSSRVLEPSRTILRTIAKTQGFDIVHENGALSLG